MVVAEPIFDFGEGAPGVKLEHDFEVRNTGDADLVVSDVIAGCACTTTEFDRQIKPGASSRIHAVLDTTSLVGALAKQIVLYTNDPDVPKSLLTLRVTVKSHLVMRPATLRLEAVRNDPPATVGTTLWSLDRPDLTVASVDSSDPTLTWSFRPAQGAELAADGRGRQWRIEATLDPAAPLGSIAVVAHVHTNDPTDGVLTLPVYGAQRLPLVLTPPSAALGEVHPGPTYRRVFRLRNLGAAPIEIERVTSDLPALSAEVSKLPDGKSFEVALRLDGALPKGDFSGTLVIHTTSREQPRLDVAVSGKAL